MPVVDNINIDLYTNSYEKYNLYINKIPPSTPIPTPIPPAAFTTINSITNIGSLPNFSANNLEGNITIEFDEGTLPSYETIKVRKI